MPVYQMAPPRWQGMCPKSAELGIVFALWGVCLS
jgi:hypothetical protein